ncbi:MAG: GH92 family glycosyl hydrolase [Prevotella stercorea]|uniref:GH92 family glycosyl hydrolase n=1 Tax=Leyella stercorea TaxID=363265 RepID=UPI0025DA69E1|nr:GH92 family glycosyl hydrolase [Prevotella sp.]MDD6495531.1 GH92 family glycosyl hydrolase [Leyella stercorea]MCI6687872.1 GH92 family glycosyl hydrolase [Prevotella sp.]MCI6718414.1 GH92 family glycosyl hydrolase [Prevotella sp.]MCI7020987.1 GH92 family glycosyl hydrolase [Prevotella sp.]
MRTNYLLRLLSVALLAVCFSVTAATAATQNLTQYVNQYVGTGGHGHTFMGANVPFGLVQLGPTEPTRGWDWCSGYYYDDDELIGFGHMHLSGTGIGCLGDVAFLPVKDFKQTSTRFKHEAEKVHPGYYSVQLTDPNVLVELTATERCGFHRYTFKNGAKAQLALDLSQCIGWDKLNDCLLTQESATRLTGFRRSNGWAADRRIYFSIDFSQPVTVHRLDSMERVVVSVADNTKPLLVKVALSPVSIDKAKLNMQAELAGWDFDAAVKQADEAWNRELARIEIQTNDRTKKRVFYTAMYHLMTSCSKFNDVDCEYRGADGKVHKADFTNYTTLSLWDTYRAAHPLMTVAFPEMQRDFAQTFLNIYKQQGRLPVWHLMGSETDCMVGNPGAIVLADLTMKGFVEDKELALEALKATQMKDIRSLGLLKKHGYIPWNLEPENETVAKALEYCAADDGVAKVAKLLGKKDDYEYFFNRSRSYKKYYDPETRFLRAVGTDGKFRLPFNPFFAEHRTNDYTEGNAWQYTFLVPHDVKGLIKLFGSDKAFMSKLDSLFFVEGWAGDNASPDMSGMTGQYAHGNEPSHHVIYMYNYAGRPDKAAPMLRKMLNEMYLDQPDGLSGNEDVGQMSAWYILSSVGLYQVDPVGGRFVIGSPLFDKATVNVGGGKTFTVVAKNNSDKNIYVQSARLNGKTLKNSYVDFNDIRHGGTLELVMGPKPSKWATTTACRP